MKTGRKQIVEHADAILKNYEEAVKERGGEGYFDQLRKDADAVEAGLHEDLARLLAMSAAISDGYSVMDNQSANLVWNQHMLQVTRAMDMVIDHLHAIKQALGEDEKKWKKR